MKDGGGRRRVAIRSLGCNCSPDMATQKPGEWVQSLITRFDAQVKYPSKFRRVLVQNLAPKCSAGVDDRARDYE